MLSTSSSLSITPESRGFLYFVGIRFRGETPSEITENAIEASAALGKAPVNESSGEINGRFVLVLVNAIHAQ